MNDMSLKAKIRNIAKERNISAQATLQNYLIGRVLYRLSKSEYCDKFIVKGGVLISSIIGIENRTTMDIDATLKGLALDEATITKALNEIFSISTDDEIEFTLEGIAPIREDDEYGGYRAIFIARFGKIAAPMSMDISTGDVITPGAEKHIFRDLINAEEYSLWSYNTETVLAEKVETILSRGEANTRPRDFYDVFVLSAGSWDENTFVNAYCATAKHRGTDNMLSEANNILDKIRNSESLETRWINYCRQMNYANQITYSDTIASLRKLIDILQLAIEESQYNKETIQAMGEGVRISRDEKVPAYDNLSELKSALGK